MSRGRPGPADETDQRAAIAFLADPATHGGLPVERIETQGSFLFLAGERARKIRRAVRYPFLDFTTLAARRRACELELELNRPTAPGLYLGLEAVLRRADGTLALVAGPPEAGDVVEWVTLMRRFPAEARLDRIAAAGGLDRALVVALAERVARIHATAPVAPGESPWGGAGPVERALGNTLRLLGLARHVVAPADPAGVARRVRGLLRRLGPALDARKLEGRIRRCHGDLHLGNIVLLDGTPCPFDAIDFNDGLSWIDVAHDLAFLLMDLDHRGRRDLANAVLNRWLVLTGDAGALGVLPIFLADKALVRAMVATTTLRTWTAGAPPPELARDACGYLAAAGGYAAPPPPRLVAVGGPSGSGKSTLGAALAPLLGPAPGAVHLRTDVIRKRLAGVPETERLPPESYTAESHARVYEALAEAAAAALAAGHAVIADGVFGEPGERAGIAAVAARAGVPFDGLWLDAGAPELVRRVRDRRGDASDATADVIERQLARGFGDVGWRRVEAAASPEAVCAAAAALIGLGSADHP